MKTLVFIAVSILGFGMNLPAENSARFESGPTQVNLLELYTSEGCSSCPPAEAWLSEFSESQDLWRAVVPVSFHVDYWDNLGWKDIFSSREFTLRQELYATRWGSQSVYTPGFVLNGAEWRGWGGAIPRSEHQQTGKLVVEATGSEIKVNYSPLHFNGPYAVEIVPLKMNVTSHVARGENAGRTLKHQFIALNLVRGNLTQSGDIFRTDIACPIDKADALAAWVTLAGSPVPIQATGGYLR
jgi:hypothetical protein